MGAIDRVMKRLGFVKLADYGLALSPEDRVVSLHDGKVVGRRAFDIDPPPLATIVLPPPRPAQKLPAQIVEDDGEDGDWDWQIALARARAVADEIERTVPSPPPAPPSPSPSPKTVTRPFASVASSRTDRLPAMTPAVEPESWETSAPPAPPRRMPHATPPPPPANRNHRAATPVTIIPVPKLPRASTNAPVTPRATTRGMHAVGDSTRRYAAAPPANDDTNPDFRPSNRHLVVRQR